VTPTIGANALSTPAMKQNEHPILRNADLWLLLSETCESFANEIEMRQTSRAPD
jgi:hypothetical protein